MESEDVENLYDTMSRLTSLEERRLYATLAPAVRSALWVLHLHKCLDEIENLTPQQRQILQEALDLAGDVRFFEVNAGMIEWPGKAEQLASLQKKASLAFSRTETVAIFLKLGCPPTVASQPTAGE